MRKRDSTESLVDWGGAKEKESAGRKKNRVGVNVAREEFPNCPRPVHPGRVQGLARPGKNRGWGNYVVDVGIGEVPKPSEEKCKPGFERPRRTWEKKIAMHPGPRHPLKRQVL